jgi:F0F1-type ATP synthase delta subunit
MKKKLQKLVELSYVHEKLDPEIVQLIASRLSRHELKQYIKLLKQEEDKKQIFVTSAKPLTNKDKEKIEKRFAGKMVHYSIDPSMLSGIKIVEGDEEYEINLDKTFNYMIQFLSKND